MKLLQVVIKYAEKIAAVMEGGGRPIEGSTLYWLHKQLIT